MCPPPFHACPALGPHPFLSVSFSPLLLTPSLSSSLPFFTRPPPHSFSTLSTSDNPYLSQLSNASYDHQTLDHFGWSRLRPVRWSQHYLYSTQHWLPPSDPNGPGPIFLYAGNEGPIETFAGNSGWMFELAESFNAMLVFVEHRFYGRSMPWGEGGNATLSYANVSTLSLLTSEQAIADYVQFVEWMRAGGHETRDRAVLAVQRELLVHTGHRVRWQLRRHARCMVRCTSIHSAHWPLTCCTPLFPTRLDHQLTGCYVAALLCPGCASSIRRL